MLRVLKTAEFLIERFHYNNEGKWHGLLSTTIDICEKYTEDKLTAKNALEQIQTLYEKREISMDIWKDLLSERGLFGGMKKLTPSVYSIIREKPELMTLYGNALFLLVHSVINKSGSKDWRIHAKTLWSAVSDWQWVHMGFVTQDDDQNRFEPAALGSNLLWRVRHLSSAPTQYRFFENIRYGKMIPLDQHRMWIVFQESVLSSKMLTGLLTGMTKSQQLRGEYETILDIPRLGEVAKEMLEVDNREEKDIAITRFEDMDLFWVRVDEVEDDRDWQLVGSFKYLAPKKERLYPIRKFSFYKVPYKVIRQVPELDVLSLSEGVEERVDDVPRQVIDDANAFVPVILEVSLDVEDAKYLVHLLDDHGEVIEYLKFEETDDVIGFIGMPLSAGTYYRSKDGTQYSWEVRTDITYCVVETTKGDVDLSFLIPLVHNGLFLSGKYIVPRTAKDLLETEMGEDLLLMAVPDMKRYRNDWEKCWSVLAVNRRMGKEFRTVENEFMRIEDIALFFECKQLVDVDTGLRHRTKMAIDRLKDVKIYDGGHGSYRMREYLHRRRWSKRKF